MTFVKRLPKLRFDQLLVCGVLLAVLIIAPMTEGRTEPVAEPPVPVYQIASAPVPYISGTSDTELGIIAQAQAASNSAWTPEQLTASGAAVIDLNSGAILFEKNPRQLLYPASTTKLMTALVARELFELDQVATIAAVPKVAGASIGFLNGEQVTIESLLKAALIQSGNEAAMLLSEQHPNGPEAFVAHMNVKAKQLHLSDTQFSNVMGFDGPQHYSTARDLALLSRAFMQDSFLRETVGTKTTTISDTRGWYRHQIWNTHQLLNPEAGVVGIKTGTTDGALEVLITQLEKNDIGILVVVLGSQDRYADTRNLLEWVAREYKWLENPSELE